MKISKLTFGPLKVRLSKSRAEKLLNLITWLSAALSAGGRIGGPEICFHPYGASVTSWGGGPDHSGGPHRSRVQTLGDTSHVYVANSENEASAGDPLVLRCRPHHVARCNRAPPILAARAPPPSIRDPPVCVAACSHARPGRPFPCHPVILILVNVVPLSAARSAPPPCGTLLSPRCQWMRWRIPRTRLPGQVNISPLKPVGRGPAAEVYFHQAWLVVLPFLGAGLTYRVPGRIITHYLNFVSQYNRLARIRRLKLM